MPGVKGVTENGHALYLGRCVAGRYDGIAGRAHGLSPSIIEMQPSIIDDNLPDVGSVRWSRIPITPNDKEDHLRNNHHARMM